MMILLVLAGDLSQLCLGEGTEVQDVKEPLRRFCVSLPIGMSPQNVRN